MKSIVVTGGAGFIGSVLVGALNRAGHKDIVVVDQNVRQPLKERNLAGKYYLDCLESEAFIRQIEAGLWNGRVEAVFHMGACSDTTEKNREYLKNNNTLYTQRLAEWALKEGIYFQYASSAATYGAGEAGYSDDDKLSASLKPLNLYGQSKLDFDLWVLSRGLEKKLVGLRFFNVYGPNEYHKGEMRSMVHKGFTQVVDQGFMRLFKSHRPDYRDGEQKRDFIYVFDAVEAMLWLFKNQKVTGIFNLGTGRAETWKELAESIFEALGKKPRIEFVDMPDTIRNQYQYFTQADMTKLKSHRLPARFRPVREGVADYIRNYLLKNPANF